MKEPKKNMLENHSKMSFSEILEKFFIVFTEKWNIKDLGK